MNYRPSFFTLVSVAAIVCAGIVSFHAPVDASTAGVAAAGGVVLKADAAKRPATS